MAENLLNYEWQALSQLIYRMNRCKDYTEFSRTILEQIQGIIPFSQGLVFKASRINSSIALSNAAIVPQTLELQYYVDKYMTGSYSPRWTSYLNSPRSSVFRYSNITPDNTWTNTPIYTDILKPQDLYYAIYMTFVHRDQPLGAIAIWRKKGQEDFSDRELFMLEMLKIHIELKLFYLLNFEVTPKTFSAYSKRSNLTQFAEEKGLTKRELEILQLMNNGKNGPDICEQLYISDSTLRKHVHNIYQKLGVKNRVQLLQLLKRI